MTGCEHQAKEVISDVIVDCRVEVRHGGLLPHLELAAEFFMLTLEELIPAKVIDGAMFGSGHKPGARIVRQTRFRPLLERGNEGVLGEFFSQTHISDHPGKPRDDPGRFDPPERVDGAMNIGSRHG